jgi:hypothetical protein
MTLACTAHGAPIKCFVRPLVSWFRLPRQSKNDSHEIEIMSVGLAERPTVTAASPEGNQSVVATLTARIETLEADFGQDRSRRGDAPCGLRARAVRTAHGGGADCRPGSGGNNRGRTRGLRSAAMVAPLGRLSPTKYRTSLLSAARTSTRSGHDVAAAHVDAGGRESAVRLFDGGSGRDGGARFQLAPVGDLQARNRHVRADD